MLEVTEEERERARFISRKRFEMDRTSEILTGYKRGLIQVISERMSKMGFSVTDIAKAMGCSEQYLKDMLADVTEENHQEDGGTYVYKILAAYGPDTKKRLERTIAGRMHDNGFGVADVVKALCLSEQDVNDIPWMRMAVNG